MWLTRSDCAAGQDSNDLANAIACYREALRIDSTSIDALSNLGSALKQGGFLREARDTYQSVIAYRPHCALAHANLASVYYDLGMLSLAVDTYKRALEIEPRLTDALNNLGNALKEMGQTQDAIRCYRRAIELRPTHKHAHNNLVSAMPVSISSILASKA